MPNRVRFTRLVLAVSLALAACGEDPHLSYPAVDPGPGTVPPATTGTPDIHVNLTWDDRGRDWELHLVKPGGRINDNATDCTWTSCIDRSPDWGVPGDRSDNPSKDSAGTGAFGPENIVLNRPEPGRYTVLVEHWGSGLPSNGRAIITVRGRPTMVDIHDLVSRHVRVVAAIDWPSGATTVINRDHDCRANWASGCRDPLP